MSAGEFAASACLVWAGMVLAISFLEAPLKFRAPGITLQLGLGIGRLVFAALNRVEIVLATAVAVALVIGGVWTGGAAFAVAAMVLLVVQLAAVRPMVRRRSVPVLAGETPRKRSGAHWWYVGFEVAKLVALLTAAAMLLAES